MWLHETAVCRGENGRERNQMNENETPETDKSVRTFQTWDVPSCRHVMVEYVFVHTAKKLERERNQLRRKNEKLLDAKIKAENTECLLDLKLGMIEQDIETIRKIITKGGTAADILKFLDTPNA